MAAIVTTMLYVPAALLLGGVFLLAGVPIRSLATFGSTLHPVAGLFAWWAIFYVPIVVYTAVHVPWGRDTPSGRAG
jgi:hypothetical protein